MTKLQAQIEDLQARIEDLELMELNAPAFDPSSTDKEELKEAALTLRIHEDKIELKIQLDQLSEK